ncbi:YggS family pyridoxal phosphate-dependent enzyme [Kitasatospora griseola]|uniref:YggS family pyridoxal phosphate-dependent enzyme n=1 Tax=Kitasatospora griseola TaxID=2064 RepID=UPI003442AE77
MNDFPASDTTDEHRRPPAGTELTRRSEIADRLATVERRIADACATASRPRDSVTLIVVTKTYPSADTRMLASLGVRHVGESRDQQAAPKAAECADLPLSWHFIGQLQTNKTASTAAFADHVHSVDRLRLVQALSDAATTADRGPLGCLIQIALDQDSGMNAHRGGAAPSEMLTLADAIATAPGLRLDGLMTVAPISGDLADSPREAFDRLAELSLLLRKEHPGAVMLSAGMSHDLEAAIAAGATHVRVGTAVLGDRSPTPAV